VIDHRRLEPLKQILAHIKEPGTARPAQEFASCRRQHVATERLNIHSHLPHRLASIEQKGDAMGFGDPPDLGRRIGKPAIGRNPGDGDELDAFVDHACERPGIEFTSVIARYDVDLRPRPLRHLQKGYIISGIFGLSGEDTFARHELKRIKSHLPGDGRVLDQGDLFAGGIEETRHRGIDSLAALSFLPCRSVATDLRFEIDMVLDRIDDRARHQSCPGIVQVSAPFGAWRVGPDPLEIHRHHFFFKYLFDRRRMP
jgi:hypothetical protein